mmetsp:Transcript_1204/g.2187  ORF Transcript_1204/g.2187 Transcript_1204/m.2187 type:complete len:649 (-) Transcript_1204:81-2027(-)|eukprot:CAMPEP_0176486052 /NCGR_PEP_ID=MMETSP0200_2-20121128/5363_1 /TAXON_ID=947934 /ORGANISM="Chaetoceros sp., Strain GSL56" /LENGTH=648 /DNA_ID=CAMNT_0017882729 /DNA_START=41 /DNA_END=1987 /DNA_ORIENTATION=+
MTNPDANSLNDNGSNHQNDNNQNSNESTSKRKHKRSKKSSGAQKKQPIVIQTTDAGTAATGKHSRTPTGTNVSLRKKSTQSGTTNPRTGSSIGKVPVVSKSSHRSYSSKSNKQTWTLEKEYKKYGLLQLPHAKVTIRNIQGVDKYGNVENIIKLLREMIQDRNQKKHEIVTLLNNTVDGSGGWGSSSEYSSMIAKVVTPRDVLLDEINIDWIMSRGGKMMWKHTNDNDDDDNNINAKDNDDKNHDNHNEKNDTNDEALIQESSSTVKGEEEMMDSSKEETRMDKVDKDATENKSTTDSLDKKSGVALPRDHNAILAKILYVVPAKKSTRRGELPGHCYLVLYPPVPSFYQEKLKILSDKIEQQVRGLSTVAENDEDDAKSKQVTEKTEEEREEEATTIMKETDSGSIVDKGPSSVHHTTTTSTITAADKSKALAQSRLLITETINSLAYLCRDKSKNDGKYSGMQIEMSQNQKIWKMEDSLSGRGGHVIRGGKKFGMAKKYDSTLEKSEDFIKFIEEKRRKEEDLASRPKPPLGGDTSYMGMHRETSVAMDNSNNIGSTNGDERISAILLHLREEKAAAKKAKKKKEKKDKKKVKAAPLPSDKVDNANKNVQGGKNGDKKRRKKKTKQDNASGMQIDPKAPPKMLRKN